MTTTRILITDDDNADFLDSAAMLLSVAPGLTVVLA